MQGGGWAGVRVRGEARAIGAGSVDVEAQNILCHSLIPQLSLSTYSVPGTVLGPGGSVGSKTNLNPYPRGANMLAVTAGEQGKCMAVVHAVEKNRAERGDALCG